jgi:hypothetical protein
MLIPEGIFLGLFVSQREGMMYFGNFYLGFEK